MRGRGAIATEAGHAGLIDRRAVDDEMLERVRVWLDWPIEDAGRLMPLAVAGAPAAFDIPGNDECRVLLSRLDVPISAVDEIIDAKPAPEADPEAWWLLERLYHTLIGRDAFDAPPPWPAPVVCDDAFTRYFHLYVFLAAVADVFAFHARRDIPQDVTWRTLRDVGLQVANYQTRHGRPGFDGAFWVWPHFRGGVYTLGRLQFETSRTAVDASVPAGEPVLGVHIPALGPLTPAACNDALDRAVAFFARHYPETSYRTAMCESWLLDEQLAEYLSPSANIVRFQRRFTPVGDWARPGDDDVLRFVFGRVPRSLDELPQSTSLERAVVTHLRAGRHWRFRRGRLVL